MPELVSEMPNENPFFKKAQDGTPTKSFNPFKAGEEEKKESTPGGNTSFGNPTQGKIDTTMFLDVQNTLKKPKRNTTPTKQFN